MRNYHKLGLFDRIEATFKYFWRKKRQKITKIRSIFEEKCQKDDEKPNMFVNRTIGGKYNNRWRTLEERQYIGKIKK